MQSFGSTGWVVGVVVVVVIVFNLKVPGTRTLKCNINKGEESMNLSLHYN